MAETLSSLYKKKLPGQRVLSGAQAQAQANANQNSMYGGLDGLTPNQIADRQRRTSMDTASKAAAQPVTMSSTIAASDAQVIPRPPSIPAAQEAAVDRLESHIKSRDAQPYAIQARPPQSAMATSLADRQSQAVDRLQSHILARDAASAVPASPIAAGPARSAPPAPPAAAPPSMLPVAQSELQYRMAEREQALAASPEQAAVVQAARDREAARQMGGVPVGIAQAVNQGRQDGTQLAAAAMANSTPESQSPLRGASPLAGAANDFRAMAGREAAQRAQAESQYAAGVQGNSAKAKLDANNNGIPDRDESVAAKFGNVGINNFSQLSNADAKYKIYMQGYRADKDAQASSRPMSFDEFAKNEQESFKKRPVYGLQQAAEQAGSPPNMAYENARMAALGAREDRNAAMTEQRAGRVAQARDQALARSARVDALQRGADAGQANAYGNAMLARELGLREAQKVRTDQTNVLAMQDSGQTGRAQMFADAQRHASNAGVTIEGLRGDTMRHDTDAQERTGLAGIAAQQEMAANQNKTATEIAEGRNKTERYGADTGLLGTLAGYGTQRYGMDVQRDNVQDTNRTQAVVAAGNNAAMQGVADTQADAQVAISGNQLRGVRDTNRSQLGVADIQSGTQRYGIDAQKDMAEGANATQRYGMDTQLDIADGANATQRYGMNAQLEGVQDTNRTQSGIAAGQDATRRYGLESTLAGTIDTNQATVDVAKEASRGGLAMAEQQAKSRMEELKVKLQDPSARIETIKEVMTLNPMVAAERARLTAEMDYQQQNPSATLPQIKAQGRFAAQRAAAIMAPMWNSIASDPQMQSLLGAGQPDGVAAGQAISPVSQVSPIKTGPLGQTDIPSPNDGIPVVPDGTWEAAQPASRSALARLIEKLRLFNGGTTPSKEQVDEALLGQNLRLDEDMSLYREGKGWIPTMYNGLGSRKQEQGMLDYFIKNPPAKPVPLPQLQNTSPR